MSPATKRFPAETLVGTTIDGRYRLVAHLAAGGMGDIFRAEHVYMRKDLALKLLRQDLTDLPDLAERFRREAEIAASLEHEHIVRVTDFGRSPEGWLFLAMELLEGETLYDRLRAGGPMNVGQAVNVLVEVCRGLEAAHRRGVIHRDLKPENVFLTRPGGRVKLLDFGIAKLASPQAASETQAGIVVGTPEYLSPEQAVGGAVDVRADVYAVGLIGWRMLAGRHPFEAEDARGFLLKQATEPVPSLAVARPELSAWPALVAALQRACAKDPVERHASAAELRADLEASLGEVGATRAALPSQAGAVSGWSVPASSTAIAVVPRRRWSRLAGAGAAVAIALVAGVWLAGARPREEPAAARAQALLAAQRPEAATAVIAPALARAPADARLHVLHGRALHRMAGRTSAALDEYAVAVDLDEAALDGAALADLAADLQDVEQAERAARLLARTGEPAVPAVLAATREGPAAARLRALELARVLGAEDRIDRVGAYAALLREGDCEIRRAAARRLGEIGNPTAVGPLEALALQTREVRGVFGFRQRVPVCGAVEADAALRRIGKAHAEN